MKHVFNPNLAQIVDACVAGEPQAAIGAARAELLPIIRLLGQRVAPAELGSLEWILAELLLNAALVTQRNGQIATPKAPLVSLEVVLPEDRVGFDVRVTNLGKPTLADHTQLERRFRHYDETRRHVEEQRRQCTDQAGRVRIPGTLGGGGLALLECIRAARANGLTFEYFIEDAPIGRTVFRVAR